MYLTGLLRRFGWNRIDSLVLVVIGIYWVSIGLQGTSAPTSVIRAVSGLLVSVVVPGILSIQLFGLCKHSRDEPDTGVLLTFGVGIGIVALSLVTVVASVVLPIVGIPNPLNSGYISVIVTVLIVGLWATVANSESNRKVPQFTLPCSVPRLGLFALLPGLAAVAAWLYNQSGDTAGMFLTITAIALVSGLAMTGRLPKREYPLTVWAVAVALLFHRNLVTSGVIGADIQYMYFVSEFILQAGYWGPDLGGPALSVPVVTAGPAAIASITGLPLTIVFKIAYVLLYAMVPVGVLYLTAEVFDAETGLYSALLFLFYHFSFYFTPGKQLVSELYLALLLLLFFRYGLNSLRLKVLALVLSLGLIMSHYGTTYVLGLALFGGATGLYLLGRVVDIKHELPVRYALVFLALATGWYTYASIELIETIAILPVGIVVQMTSLLTGTAVGSGATIVAQQETLIGRLNVYLYLLFTVLLCLGLFWRVYRQWHCVENSDPTQHVEYTSIAVLFFIFLGSSYFVIVNLYADRAYQMALPVLAPFVPLGITVLHERIGIPSFADTNWPRWPGLMSLLLVLLLLNSGFIMAAAGLPTTDYTFDRDAHDYAFTAAEREAGSWLANRPDVRRVGPLADTSVDSTEPVPIYTDSYTYQMLRSSVPPDYFSTELVMIKNQWNPEFDADRIQGGYVVIRNRSVRTVESDEQVGLGSLTQANVNQLKTNRTVVFSNEDVTILGAPNETGLDSSRAAVNG